jgi:hypothetical protein
MPAFRSTDVGTAKAMFVIVKHTDWVDILFHSKRHRYHLVCK